jgi:ABC-type nitrate/sulfonate/bicarbonate transport system substrate-binding protein
MAGVAFSLSGTLLAACGGDDEASGTTAGATEGASIPRVNVRFGILPFGDQTLAVIGVKEGWFDEVGITLTDEPNGTPVLPDQTVPLLVNGQLDVVTCWTPLFVQSMGQAPDLRVFQWVDTFYGTFVMAAPETQARPIKDFIDEGQSFDQAIKTTLDQMNGKRYAIDNTGNNLAFYNTALRRMGGLDLEKDTRLAVVDDPRIVQLAIGRQIDFATASGAPQVARLLEEDWHPILGIEDILRYGPPGAASDLVGHSGMATTQKYLDENRDTVLRFSSVMFRIIDAILDDPDRMLATQLPYLESRTGGKVGLEGLKNVIMNLDPLTPFEEQADYWTNTSSPFYFKTLYVGQIKAAQEGGILPKDEEFAPEDIIVGDDIYTELVRLKGEYEELESEASDVPSDKRKLADDARKHYDARNYLDAVRFLKAALA